MANLTPTNAFAACVTGALLAGITMAAPAAETAPPAQSVMVLVDRFSFDGWTSANLDTLAATMRAIRPGEVELVACGSEATWALQAVVQRLSDLPLKLQTLPASAPACAGAPVSRSESQRIDMASADHTAVARYWAQVMP